MMTTDWDAWDDFTRALTGHLYRGPIGSMVRVIAPHRFEIGIAMQHDMMLTIFRAAAALSHDQINTLRNLDWEQGQGEWAWHAFRDEEEVVEVVAARVLVHTLIDVLEIESPDMVVTSLLRRDRTSSDLTAMMVPPAAPITRDTAGLRRDRDYHVDTSTGAVLGLLIYERALQEPYWLDDLELAQRHFAHKYSSLGCLIEAKAINVGGVRSMARIYKAPIPRQDHWTVFGVDVVLAKATQTAQISYFMDETRLGHSGAREAIVVLKLQNYLQPEPHPYDPELHGRLPFLRSDDEVWDDQFPGHPLTCVRAWLRDINRIVTVDPAFAALPDFRGTARQNQGQ